MNQSLLVLVLVLLNDSFPPRLSPYPSSFHGVRGCCARLYDENSETELGLGLGLGRSSTTEGRRASTNQVTESKTLAPKYWGITQSALSSF